MGKMYGSECEGKLLVHVGYNQRLFVVRLMAL